MGSKNIFIHIPKTGGTTINCVMNKSEWQTQPDFNYRHILYETKRSNSKDIFNPMNFEKYSDYHVFMLLRNPIDRLISEYYFIKDRKEFLGLLKPVPRNLKEYVLNPQTQNYMIGFLLGKRMYDTDRVDRSDLELVINSIKTLNIHVGIFEDYSRSLSYFSSITGIKLPKKIDVKRITLNRPALREISEEIKTLIRKNNALDFELYEFCQERFRINSANVKLNDSFQFKGDKYNYVIKYTERFNLLEIGLKNKAFINKHSTFFQDLNVYLHKVLKIKDGRDYVKLWNAYFEISYMNTYPNSRLSKRLKGMASDITLLDRTKEICKLIDQYGIERKKVQSKNEFLTFNKDLIKFEDYINKSGLFSKIKSKLFK